MARNTCIPVPIASAVLSADMTQAQPRGRQNVSPNVRLRFIPRGPEGQAGRLEPPADMRMRIGSVQLVLLQ